MGITWAGEDGSWGCHVPRPPKCMFDLRGLISLLPCFRWPPCHPMSSHVMPCQCHASGGPTFASFQCDRKASHCGKHSQNQVVARIRASLWEALVYPRDLIQGTGLVWGYYIPWIFRDHFLRQNSPILSLMATFFYCILLLYLADANKRVRFKISELQTPRRAAWRAI